MTLQFHRFQCLGSTNAEAKAMATSGAPHGTVVIAEEQTAGRGRLGRRFFSPKGSGVYLSMILRPQSMGLDGSSTVLLTTAASVAVTRAVKRLLDLDLQIKWVNDLYYRGFKVCGILAEGIIDPHCGVIDAIILGIGVNYREPDGGFPEGLRDIAGALTADGSSCDALAEAIAEELWELLPEVMSLEFLKEYKERSMVLGRRVRIFPKGAEGDHPDLTEAGAEGDSRGDFCGDFCDNFGLIATAVDIADDGGLVIRYDDGTVETLTTGEISLRIV